MRAARNPLAAGDAALLLEAVSRHEFLLNGLRNRDLRGFSTVEAHVFLRRSSGGESAAVTRQSCGCCKLHGLIRKVPKTQHRYAWSAKRVARTITALLGLHRERKCRPG